MKGKLKIICQDVVSFLKRILWVIWLLPFTILWILVSIFGLARPGHLLAGVVASLLAAIVPFSIEALVARATMNSGNQTNLLGVVFYRLPKAVIKIGLKYAESVTVRAKAEQETEPKTVKELAEKTTYEPFSWMKEDEKVVKHSPESWR